MDDLWGVAVLVFFVGCLAALPISLVVLDRVPERARQPRTGGIYSVGKAGDYQIAKVLVVDPSAVHVRIYAGTRSMRPTKVNPADLRLGGDDPGIGHLPITHAVFATSQPQLITVDAVLPEELDGYDMWKEAGGNVWGDEHRAIRPGRSR
jgi:hypothetical protein